MSKYLTTFDVPVKLSLDTHGQWMEAQRAINLHHTGKSFVPNHETPPDAQRLATNRIRNGTMLILRVGLLPDGSLEIVDER